MTADDFPVANGSRTITETVRSVISGLYSLTPGYALTKAPSTPADGMAIMIMKDK